MAKQPTSNAPLREDPPRTQRQHKATYARDKYSGGWNVRVIGPHARQFAGREVPVTRADDSESIETLDKLIWSGTDDETARPVALYSFVPKEREDREQTFSF